MTTNGNLAALKQCYERWDETKGGSTEDWLAMMDEEIDFRSLAMAQSPEVKFTAPRTCKDEICCYLNELLDDWDMDFHRVDDYVVDGDKICAVGSTAWTNKRTGIRVESPKLDYVTFKDGKIVAFHEFYDTAKMIAAAGGIPNAAPVGPSG
jgi:uncharacterized protein